MFGLSPLVAALVATIAALLVSTWWFGVHRRRLAETQAGVQALAGMKWRECAGLVLQAMEEKGYKELPSSRQPGDGGAEFLLVKGDERCLLGYKHGTAYRLGEANVRDFANAVQLQGAASGMLVTLGTAEGFARDLARRYGVDLTDGRSLWPQVEPFAAPQMVAAIREQAAREIRKGQRLGIVASALFGLAVFGLGYSLQSGDVETLASPAANPAPAPAPTTAAPAAAPATDAPADDPTAAGPAAPESRFTDQASRDAEGALRELEEVARLTEQERIERRLAAAAEVGELEAADSAIWSTQSTLVIRMNRADGIDTGLVNEACAILVQYEELRYTRLQLEPPAGGTGQVRWRQCQ
ncbi:restriction endonuclease [Arenimonas sp.]|uniref:restriction endonuclease n=1 Tax=Arenimonas sp. TaxID=1872635 RepID=UPI0035AE4EA1